jgi:hypothetical protein
MCEQQRNSSCQCLRHHKPLEEDRCGCLLHGIAACCLLTLVQLDDVSKTAHRMVEGELRKAGSPPGVVHTPGREAAGRTLQEEEALQQDSNQPAAQEMILWGTAGGDARASCLAL